MLSKDEKRNLLLSEFKRIDIDSNDLLSKEEFFRALDDKISDGIFDRNVGEQLFERMDKDFDGRVTLEEFFEVFHEAELSLTEKISRLKLEIEECTRKKRETLNTYQDRSRTEMINAYGIMEGSILSVGVLEGRALIPTTVNFEFATWVQLSCGGQNEQTEIAESVNPKWKGTFTFQIQTGQEILNVSVIDSSNNQILGVCNVGLSLLIDQTKKEEWLPLYSMDGKITDSKILLALQWIYSSAKYYEALVRGWEETIEADREDLEAYESDLRHLYIPFTCFNHKYQEEKSKKSLFEALGNKNISLVKSPMAYDAPKKEEEYEDFEAKRKMQMMNYAVGVITLAYFLFILLVGFERSAFLDILIFGVLAYTLFGGFLTSYNLKLLGVFVIFSMILDIAWLVVFTNGWWDRGSCGVYSDPSIGTKRLAVVISYFLIFLKIGVIAIVGFLYLNTISTQLSKEENPFTKKDKFNIKYSTNFNRVDY